jgi:hypothetical protein
VRLFVALADGDNIGYPTDDGGVKRESVLSLFPKRLVENVLISVSYRHELHTRTNQHRGVHQAAFKIKRIFADCGAYQYRTMDEPKYKNGDEVTASTVWERYENAHVQHADRYEEILLCSPDHILDKNTSRRNAERRIEFTRKHAVDFFELCRKHGKGKVTPVGVIHGRTQKQRIEMLKFYKEAGYKYVALGSMVPLSGKRKKALRIVAGISNLKKPKLGKNSILALCKDMDLKLHILGLNSPEWQRWWLRLGVHSVDGSKLANEGGVNGWYWMKREEPHWDGLTNGPSTATELYTRERVKDFSYETWQWTSDPLPQPIVDEEIRKRTACDCPACVFLRQHPCQSKVCQRNEGNSHASDPRMRGSTEHNMGRAAHDAHVLDYIMTKMEEYVKTASDPEKVQQYPWLSNWTPIE